MFHLHVRSLLTAHQGHTATLYQGDKLLVFGGENEHRTYLSDLIIFDLKTAHWTQPTVSGPIPKGRARHAALLHDDKLFIIGGITGHDNYVLDDICYIDLKTFTWSRPWRFVGRFDHSAYVWLVNFRSVVNYMIAKPFTTGATEFGSLVV